MILSWILQKEHNPADTFILFIYLFCFLGLHLWHMEVSRLGVQSELQLPAYAIATAMQDLSHVCDLYHSSWKCWFLNPMSKARDRKHTLMDTSQVHSPLSNSGNSH